MNATELEELGRHYEECAQTLKRRIMALIPKHPEILGMTACDLFQVPGFTCDDLEPTMAMADAALAYAKYEYQNRRTIDSEWER